MTKKIIILLDAGHGSVIDGVPQTAGKRSPIWPDGSQLFEGEFNRAIVAGIMQQLIVNGVDCRVLVADLTDAPLSERVSRENKIAKANPDALCVTISAHSNAGGGKGFEAFTSKGQTMSDIVAQFICNAFKNEFPDKPLRADHSDGDLDKESNFYILRKTRGAAVLTENFFMDNEDECKNILMTKLGRQRIINYHVAGLMNFINYHNGL